MPRNFDCPETSEPCENNNCKTAFCVLRDEADRHRKMRESAKELRWLEALEGVAREALLYKGIRNPPYERLRNAMNHPAVIAEARQRLENPDAEHWSQISN
ncbi:MAG: hypothetical protein EOS25_11040 [Mesorhizobium sp.]|uniref:hypothetical protein n=1 Tax=Mesorhizobium sp. TaxID=1871066 RepID=UPI000FE8E222|nr:hypothetical protein [Mesorhizobium sp.]RWD45496.1 MAG: hypothetical protein EOS59_21615 [Mesorhizobium sp.]RWE51987.1 MAG: hypothetical protein EOS24_31560 [Mesorhizobium sp.]RWF07105.1 MAG: hypothetical protein EOS69_30205 [Mesorhizobium sp.]RWF19363.1 MAG: hypothetical protein EOS25_11040 [Mesorhizobium sp.]TIY05028.1 MAG: hypothetical protein E5V22_09035 [Mesorhizobium sp.]